MGDPIPFWRDDPDYFPLRDERRSAHMADRHRRRIDSALDAAVADGSFAVVIRAGDLR